MPSEVSERLARVQAGLKPYGGPDACRFENPKVAKAVPPVVNFGDTLNFGEPLADSFAKDFTLELDRVKVGPISGS